MFDPKDFAAWLRKRHPQYSALPDRDVEFIEAASTGDLKHMAAYDANRQFFMKQIVEYLQDRQLRNRVLCLAIAVGLALVLSGLFALAMLGAR